MSEPENCRILIVDDNEINRDLLQLRLGIEGYAVETANDGAGALAAMQLPNSVAVRAPGVPVYNLVLLDVMMPQVSGIDVLRHIRQYYTRADLPVIMVTAKDASDDVVEALQAGANDYVTKPIDFPVMFERMRAALQLQYLTRQKDEFIAIASHDLKNPLATVRGFVRMVQQIVPEGSPMTADARDMLARVFRQTTTMEHIISDFLDFQAMEEGKLILRKELIPISRPMKTVVDALLTSAADKGIELQMSVPPGLPTVTADEARIEQVLQNFVGNAIKFCSAGCSVVLSAKENENGVMVQVHDDGPGIQPGDEELLFVKYARLSNHPTAGEKSSGLGLVICKQIVELHGGTVGAHNNVDKPGAVFWFTVPAK